MGSEMKQVLKNLCFNHGWSYAVFWRYDPINSMLLGFEESYNDEQSVAFIDDMILQGHILLGQGIVGEVASTGNHQWLFSDTLFQCEHEFQNQFLSGFQTIAIIPVGSRGVVQLGSIQNIPESAEILEQTTRPMHDMFLKQDQSVDLDSLFESLVPLGDCEIVPAESFQGFSFDDIFANDDPPSLLSPEMMISAEAASSSQQDLVSNEEDGFGFDILNSYTLDDLYELLADSPEQNQENSMVLQGNDKDLFDILGMKNSQDLSPEQNQENSMVIQGNDQDLFDLLGLNFSQDFSTTPLAMPPPKGLFSELISSSLNLNNNSTCCTSLTNEYSVGNQSKKRKLETSSSSLLESTVTGGRSLWIDDERSSIGGNWKEAHEEGVKNKKKKKRAKAGESRRPRPKDRQMIQDRIKELRGMIPNGAKCSIDTLLDLTIKHMEFMQSLAKYADRLKQPYESKMVKEKERTWAVEVRDEEEVVCPIMVEDLNTQGEMQIEMVCEEREEFLEIGDVVRGLGLKILKGVMESRQGQIWAHFIVHAANPQVTRLHVFYSLLQLFQNHSKHHHLL